MQETISKMPSNYHYIMKEDVKPLLRRRRKFDHKGSYGHALLMAGSYGKAGAATLSACAALRSGAGLVTVHTPVTAVTPVQAALPEAMVSPDAGTEYITSVPDLTRYDAVGVGPGIGTDPDTRKALQDIARICQCPACTRR